MIEERRAWLKKRLETADRVTIGEYGKDEAWDIQADIIELIEERTVAAESRKEGIEAGLGGRVRKVEAFALRPIDGKGVPQYCLRIDMEYDNMIDRDEAAGWLKEQG